MTKRGNNEGSVYFAASSNLYRAAVTLPDGSRKVVSAKTRRACATKLTALQSQVAAGLPAASGDRLGPFLDWWLETLEAKAAAGSKSVVTVDNARWAVEGWIKPALGTKRLKELEPEDVESILTKMAAAGRARRSVTRVRSYLGQALAVAERRGKVARNVARISEMPTTKRPPDQRSLTPDQAEALLAAIEGDRLQALFITGLMLGLRPGELTGLAWTDVDLDNTDVAGGDVPQARTGQADQRHHQDSEVPAPAYGPEPRRDGTTGPSQASAPGPVAGRRHLGGHGPGVHH